jgi:Fe-Mn family superoxide dismutase
MAFQLAPLPYEKDALEPHMSAETLAYHHGKHHKTYVEKLNALIEGSDLEGESLETIITLTKDSPDSAAIFNNAAQSWNHDFFWQCLHPGGDKPSGEIGRRIDASFGSFDAFRNAFADAANGQFGSGWAWLVMEIGGKLSVVATPNAVPPFVNGLGPLLACDVWEHAYYIDYRNDRATFVDTFLDKLANWEFAESRLGR